jgi:hypothetical protein
MRNITAHTGTLRILKRLDSSPNGNPRYLISIDGFTCKTMVDSMHAYEVPNFIGIEVTATIGTHYKQVTLNTIKEASLF